jgi:hypothetical protein
MNTRQLSRGLGWFSIGLGVAELFAPRQLAELIGVEDNHDNLIRALGAREIAAGVSLLAQPQESGWLWSRIAGDAMDLSLLGVALASPRNNRQRLIGATAAVAAVTAVDVLATMIALRPPKVHPRWRYTPAGGRAGIDRAALARSPAARRTPEELVDRPLASAAGSGG